MNEPQQLTLGVGERRMRTFVVDYSDPHNRSTPGYSTSEPITAHTVADAVKWFVRQYPYAHVLLVREVPS